MVVMQALRSPLVAVQSLARIPGSLVLGALFALLILAGSRGNWVTFPMTAPISATQIPVTGLPLSAGGLLALLLLLTLLAATFSRGLACVVWLAALALLFRVPLELALHQPEWLQNYLVQLADRIGMTQFVAEHYVLNVSPEPTMVPMDRIDSTDDQLRLAMLMLSRSWYFTVAVSLGLFFTLMGCWSSTHRAAWLSVPGVLLAAGLLLPPLWSLEQAQGERDRGDLQLNAGDGARALQSYAAAYAANPGLMGARPFWLQVAMAQAQASGGRNVYAELVRPLSLVLGRTPLQDAAAYEAASQQLTALALPPASDALQAGLLQQTAALRNDLLVQEALLHYNAGNFNRATSVMQRAQPSPTSAARFYLAAMTMSQGGYLQAAEMLKALDAQLAHVTVRADIACTLGDAYTGAGLTEDARTAYLNCQSLDELTNYRATKALGGT